MLCDIVIFFTFFPCNVEFCMLVKSAEQTQRDCHTKFRTRITLND